MFSAKKTVHTDLSEEIEELKFCVSTQELIVNAKTEKINQLKDEITHINQSIISKPIDSSKVSFRALSSSSRRLHHEDFELIRSFFNDKGTQTFPYTCNFSGQTILSNTDIHTQTDGRKFDVSLAGMTVIAPSKKLTTDIDTQTENSEETLILEQVIKFKQDLLNQTDSKLARAKSKLLHVKKQIERSQVPVESTPFIICKDTSDVETQTSTVSTPRSPTLVRNNSNKRKSHRAYSIVQNLSLIHI